MEGFQVFLVILAVLVVLAGLAYYVVTKYDDPPLWWPNFMRPGWAKDPEDFTDVSQLPDSPMDVEEGGSFTGVGASGKGSKYTST
mmetsp:Transcript_26925/g.53718  ORF Transcript_26925/g.53718 Transcript_26925/m.53718 type:complete len:85 (-) Transcript_26925:64-318(-)|eukprot:CAMPEP_0182459558 /NCGR_PEP_ID=MMETSP1319-20130603/4657_1 /TAXON_ID=172717 /ORGANISM="Bolidomonas pacifica, Strain RCC208" /LENGTH=84 /DNA_ID=CAMNT_0024658501 /DNA_START=165 /DNA_END=419 /DNA_ORIENTATION=-